MVIHHHISKLQQVSDRDVQSLLFIIAVECLSIYIKNNNSIKGIIMGRVERKITQLADDTTLFLRDIGSIQTTKMPYCCFIVYLA